MRSKNLRRKSRFVDSAQILMLRPFCSSPLTAFRLRRISSGSCRGVQELRRRDLLLYVAGGISASAGKIISHINLWTKYWLSRQTWAWILITWLAEIDLSMSRVPKIIFSVVPILTLLLARLEWAAARPWQGVAEVLIQLVGFSL